jgi:electron transport complex protein RnfC
MIDDAEFVLEGVRMLRKHLGIDRVVIAIEDNKPKPLEIMRSLSGGEELEVRALPSMYPQGGEKVLVYNITGRIVPEGKLPLDVGVIVINVTTLAVIARYIKTGMPLVAKCITVDGPAVRSPKNVIAPIGTPVGALFEFCGGFKEEAEKIVLGGPMMGIAVSDLKTPVLKNQTRFWRSRKGRKDPEVTACIKCGRCAALVHEADAVCVETAYKLKKLELLERYRSTCYGMRLLCLCMSAKRRLVQVMKLAKPLLRDYQAAKRPNVRERRP